MGAGGERPHLEQGADHPVDLPHDRGSTPLAPPSRLGRDGLDVTRPDGSRVDLEHPLHHGCVSDRLTVVQHHDVEAADRMLPVLIGELAVEGTIHELSHPSREVGRCLFGRKPVDGRHPPSVACGSRTSSSVRRSKDAILTPTDCYLSPGQRGLGSRERAGVDELGC